MRLIVYERSDNGTGRPIIRSEYPGIKDVSSRFFAEVFDLLLEFKVSSAQIGAFTFRVLYED